MTCTAMSISLDRFFDPCGSHVRHVSRSTLSFCCECIKPSAAVTRPPFVSVSAPSRSACAAAREKFGGTFRQWIQQTHLQTFRNDRCTIDSATSSGKTVGISRSCSLPSPRSMNAPRVSNSPNMPNSPNVPAAIRREAGRRDGGRCRFVAAGPTIRTRRIWISGKISCGASVAARTHIPRGMFDACPMYWCGGGDFVASGSITGGASISSNTSGSTGTMPTITSP